MQVYTAEQSQKGDEEHAADLFAQQREINSCNYTILASNSCKLCVVFVENLELKLYKYILNFSMKPYYEREIISIFFLLFMAYNYFMPLIWLQWSKSKIQKRGQGELSLISVCFSQSLGWGCLVMVIGRLLYQFVVFFYVLKQSIIRANFSNFLYWFLLFAFVLY